MTSPSVLANTPMSQQLVAITSVDPVGLTAVGFTRQQDHVSIDLRYPVGAVHVIPCVGEQWVLRKVGMNWALDRKLPKNTNITLNIADNPVQGMVQIGSSGVGSGPLLLDGIVINANANITMNSSTLYRDLSGVLQSSVDEGVTWNPVVTLSSSNYMVRVSPTVEPDGSTKVFTLPSTPIAGSEMIFLAGVLQQITVDYTISGATVTFVSAPSSGASLVATYFKELT